MACNPFVVKGASGAVVGVGFACTRGDRRIRPCSSCGQASTLLCDEPLRGSKKGKTCDAPLCRGCAVEVGPDRHLCPPHARATKGDGIATASSARATPAHADDPVFTVRLREAYEDEVARRGAATSWLEDVICEEEGDPGAMEGRGRGLGAAAPAAVARAFGLDPRDYDDIPFDGAPSDPRAQAAHAQSVAEKVAHVRRARQLRNETKRRREPDDGGDIPF